MSQKDERPHAEQQEGPPVEPSAPPLWQWWLLAAAAPLVICASKLNLDFWYDEAYTLEVFLSKPWLDIATDYSAPNNHVLYSLLLKPIYAVSQSEFVLRLPSLAFTVGTLVMVFWLARRWAGPAAAVLATLLLGLTQMFLIHTMQVRGYGLSMFLAAWLGVLALPAAPGVRWPRLVGIVLAGAALLYVIPTNLLFLVPLAVAAVVLAGVRERRPGPVAVEVTAWGGACVLAGLAYLPIRDQVIAAAGDVDRDFAVSMLQLTYQVFWAAARDWLPVVALAVIALGLWLWELRRELRRPGRPKADKAGPADADADPAPDHAHKALVLALLLLASAAGPFLMAAMLGIRPFPRNFCPMLPLLAVAIGWLLSYLFDAVGRLAPFTWSTGTTAVAGGLLLAAVAGPRIWTYPARLDEYRRGRAAQDGYFNYYAADFHPSEVAAYLNRNIDPGTNYVIRFTEAEYFPLWFYLRREGLLLQRAAGSSAQAPTIYLITPPRPDYDALSLKCGIPPDVLRRFALVHDFGYYRLYSSEQPEARDSTDWFSPR